MLLLDGGNIGRLDASRSLYGNGQSVMEIGNEVLLDITFHKRL